MTNKSWSPEEREEFSALCSEAWSSSTTTRERVDEFVRLLRDAEQAQRLFARETLREAVWIGAASILKRWNKANNRVAVAYDGRVIAKPRVIGTTRTSDDGRPYSVQTLFDFMTFEEIEAKVHEYLRQVAAYRENIHVCTRLLELRDLVPDASTPADAAQLLGTTVEEFLAAGAA